MWHGLDFTWPCLWGVNFADAAWSPSLVEHQNCHHRGTEITEKNLEQNLLFLLI